MANCSSTPLDNNCYERTNNSNYYCKDSRMNAKKNSRFEVYGENSRCFEGDNKGTLYSICLEFEVVNNKLFIVSFGKSYECTKENESIKIEQTEGNYIYSANILCPNPKEFIEIYKKTNCPYDCYGNGHCSDGKCICYDSYDPSTSCRTFLPNSVHSTSFISYMKF